MEDETQELKRWHAREALVGIISTNPLTASFAEEVGAENLLEGLMSLAAFANFQDVPIGSPGGFFTQDGRFIIGTFDFNAFYNITLEPYGVSQDQAIQLFNIYKQMGFLTRVYYAQEIPRPPRRITDDQPTIEIRPTVENEALALIKMQNTPEQELRLFEVENRCGLPRKMKDELLLLFDPE